MISMSQVGRKKKSESPTGFVNVTILLFGFWFSPSLPRFFSRGRSHFLKAGFLVGTEAGGGGTGEEKRKESFSVLLFTPDLPTLLGVRCALTGRGVGWGGRWRLILVPNQ